MINSIILQGVDKVILKNHLLSKMRAPVRKFWMFLRMKLLLLLLKILLILIVLKMIKIKIGKLFKNNILDKDVLLNWLNQCRILFLEKELFLNTKKCKLILVGSNRMINLLSDYLRQLSPIEMTLQQLLLIQIDKQSKL